MAAAAKAMFTSMADGVGAGALVVGEELGVADPVVRLFVQDLVRGALVGAGVQGGDDGCSSGASGGAGSTGRVREPATGADSQVLVTGLRAARVGGRRAVMSSRPVTAVEPRGVRTRVA
ncbi:hypothetical protein ACFSNO_01195 [Streptomyces cirratus]